MQKGGWIIGENDEACYIDVDRNENDENHEYSNWSNLPELILEEIFGYLSVKDRYYASLVCRNWYDTFYLPQVWSNFIIDDQTLTRAKFNYYSGWQYVLDHFRTQNCFARIGGYIRGLEFRPVHSFNNLYQFMTLISWYMEQADNPKINDIIQVGGRIRSLTFIFPCNMTETYDPEGIKLFGTGGQLLAALKRLMANLLQLKSLKLIDLMLERYDAKHLLDEVLNSCNTVLRELYLVNVTKVHCPIMHLGLFFNLKILVISPQNVDDDVLMLLADSNIRHLHLLQNCYTPSHICIAPCSGKAWQIVKRDNPHLAVHLRVESTSGVSIIGSGNGDGNNGGRNGDGNNGGGGGGLGISGAGEILLQPEAPVYSIMYHTPKTQISMITQLAICEMYKNSLTAFGHELLPKFINHSKTFHSRPDSLFVLMAKQCSHLNTLIIRERISTATVLLIALAAEKTLQYFYVRRNAIILRWDWPKNPEWSEEFYQWLRSMAKTYESTEQEVGEILKRKSWKMLSDQEFKRISVSVRHSANMDLKKSTFSTY